MGTTCTSTTVTSGKNATRQSQADRGGVGMLWRAAVLDITQNPQMVTKQSKIQPRQWTSDYSDADPNFFLGDCTVLNPDSPNDPTAALDYGMDSGEHQCSPKSSVGTRVDTEIGKGGANR